MATRTICIHNEQGEHREKIMNETHILKEFRMALDQLVEADEFSGSVLVAKDQTILLEQAYGMAHQSNQVPNRLDTRFNLGSMNKMFTALAVAQQVSQGKLAFGDSIATFVPEYPREIAEKITIHHLLTHTSGLGHYWNPQFWKERFLAERANLRTINDYFPLFREEPLAFEPGERFQYSNAGFIVLGAIIERVSGQEYWTYVREHIFEPATMHNTDAYEVDNPPPNQAIGYTHLSRDREREVGPRRPNLDACLQKDIPQAMRFQQSRTSSSSHWQFVHTVSFHQRLPLLFSLAKSIGQNTPASDMLTDGKRGKPMDSGSSDTVGSDLASVHILISTWIRAIPLWFSPTMTRPLLAALPICFKSNSLLDLNEKLCEKNSHPASFAENKEVTNTIWKSYARRRSDAVHR